MEENKTSNRIHPLAAGAAVSVMLVSLVGVAAITGLIPSSHSTAAPSATLAPSNAAAIATAASSPAALVDPKTAPKVAADNTDPAPAKSASAHRDYAPRSTHNTHSQARSGYDNSTPVAQAPSICASCGRVESVQAIQQQAKPSGVGIAAGAVLGGVLGHQVGGGNGRTLATVAGAVGGGYAGNEVEKRARATTSYQVRVRMEDGSVRTFPYAAQPGWSVGDRVKVVDGHLTARA